MKPDITLFYTDKQAELNAIRRYAEMGYIIKVDPNRKSGDGITLVYRGSDEEVNT